MTKTVDKKKTRRCRHCEQEYHPADMTYCPQTGKRIIKWGLVVLLLCLSVLVIILSITLIIVITNDKRVIQKNGDTISNIKKLELPTHLKKIFQSGGITMTYQAGTQDTPVETEMAKAFLDQFGKSEINNAPGSNKEFIVSGLIQDKDKPLKAEIRLKPPAKTPPSESGKNKNSELEKELEKVKTQLSDEETKREEIEKKLEGEEQRSRNLEEKLKAEKKEKERLNADKENLENKKIELVNTITKLEGEVKAEAKKLNDEKKEKERIKDKCYVAYLSLAEKYYKHRDWNKALAAIQKALIFKTTREATEAIQLRERIYKMKKERGDEKIVNFLNLPHDIKNKYIAEIEKIDMLILPGEIDVKGELNLILSVTSDGKIVIQEFIDDYINVSPENKINVVKERISKRIEGASLSPPKEKSNNSVRVEYWGVRFKLKTFRGEMKLTLIK